MRRVTRTFPREGDRSVFVTEVTAPGQASWLVFTAPAAGGGDSGDGGSAVRRWRLYGFPNDWSVLSDAELWTLYELAAPAPTSSELATHGAVIAEIRRQTLAVIVPRPERLALREEELAERLEFTEALLAAAYDRVDELAAALAAAEAALALTNDELQAMNAELQSALGSSCAGRHRVGSPPMEAG